MNIECLACDSIETMNDASVAEAYMVHEDSPNETADDLKAPFGERGGVFSINGDNFILSALSAVALTVLLYVGLLPRFADSFFADFLRNRGLVPYFIVFLSHWAFVKLGFKWLALRRQSRIVGVDILFDDGAGKISPERARGLAVRVRDHFSSYTHSILVERVARALERFHDCRDVLQVSEFLQFRSEADADCLESGNRVLKVFVAAIPILAFIGTVSGIGQAVNHFAHFIQTAKDFEILQQGLRNVTAGLGVAFDTTLLGLSMSLLITVPVSFVQRAEEKFLGYVDEYCKNHLLARLESEPPNSRAEQEEAIRRAIETEMAKHQQEFQSWTNRLDETGEKILSQVSAGMTKLCSELHDREKAFAETLADQETARYRETCLRLENLQGTAETKFQESFETLLHKANALQDALVSKTENLVKCLDGIGTKVLDAAERQREMLMAERVLLAKIMKQHEKTVARMQAQTDNAYDAVLKRLEGFLTASGHGLETIGGLLNRMAATHESRMLEFSKSFAAGMEHAMERGQRACEHLSAEMSVLQENETRITAGVGDLNRSLVLCASMLEQVRTGLTELTAAAAAHKKRRGGYSRRIARFFGMQEGVKS